MRLIDADAMVAKCGDWYTNEGSKEGFIGSIKNLVDQMPTIALEWRWIPREERNPDEADCYLVTLDNGKRAFRWYSLLHGWERISGNEVTAWLPNPEPYRVFEQIVDLFSRSQNNGNEF